ncbi:metalloendoproteinase 3-MMP-like [Impatiens glandulifera]|uniref:metalloendoproteinase 3-MMP-like n=1 Tax=Impatiens glandulifera TaxID=253017 RepID=UPI001FB186A5|nr:metalloendoproteinase 3-MMP-like [Impatiens glandulifera]
MAAKPHLQLPTIILVLSIGLAFVALASAFELTSPSPSSSPSPSPLPSPFGFLKHLIGCHKGEKVKGIKQLKNYLEKFGYVHYDHSNKSQTHDDDFDDILEAAVKTYQKNYHLRPTGVLDAQTVLTMSMPRCGCPDIINGTNTMEREHGRHLGSLRIVSHFQFFDGKPKWPAGKTHLTYGFQPGATSQFSNIMTRAYNKWASVTHFTFSQVNFNSADMKVGFHGQKSGDDTFDGPGGVLAHAWAPTNGQAHYDVDEIWADGVVPGAYDLESVALHEIGHQLGLAHSQVQNSIMWPSIAAGTRKGLVQDDIQGIKTLYGV